MANKEVVTKVSVAEGCIGCDVCETACPEVFYVQNALATLLPPAQKPDFTRPLTEKIQVAAQRCPVEVIQLETEPAGVVVAAAVVPGGDPGMQALLQAATTRGGRLGVERVTEKRAAVQALRTHNGAGVAADARFAQILDSAKPKPKPAAKKAKKGEEVSRGIFVAAMLAGWAGIAAAGALMVAWMNRFMFPNVLEEPDPHIRVGPLEKYATLPPGTVNEDFKPQGVWLYRGESRLVAMSTICTHLGCIPNWLENDRKFKCPCHGSGYTEKGVNFEGPAPRPLERFALSLVDGQVVVDKSTKFVAMGPTLTDVWNDPEAFISV